MSIFTEGMQSTSGQPIDVSAADYDITGTTKSSMRSLLVGVAGNVVGRQSHDTADVTYPVPAGYNPLRFKIIRKTGTTATGLVGLF